MKRMQSVDNKGIAADSIKKIMADTPYGLQ